MLIDFAWIRVVRLPEEFHSSGVFMAQATRHQAKPMVTEFDHNLMGMLIHGFWCFLAAKFKYNCKFQSVCNTI